jgi:hypothetical protein
MDVIDTIEDRRIWHILAKIDMSKSFDKGERDIAITQEFL